MKGNRGSALAITIIVVAVLAILGVALLNITLAENKFSIHEENRIKAYYIARAGAEAVASYIADKNNPKATIQSLVAKDKAQTNFGGGYFEVDFPINSVYTPTIRSTGTYRGISQTVTLPMKKKYYFDAALYITEGLTLPEDEIQNNHLIYGTVNIHENKYDELKDQLNLQNGEPKSTDIEPEHPQNPGLPNYSTSLWTILDGTTVTASDTHNLHSFDTININTNALVTFDTSAGDIKVYANYLNVYNNAQVTVIGGNALHIYIGTKLDFKQILTTVGDTKVIFYLLDGSTAEFKTGNTGFNGAIIGPGATVDMKSTVINGPVMAGCLNIGSDTNIKFDAQSGNGNMYPEDLGMGSLGYSRGNWDN